ncbi:MAG: carbohydrate porin [Myxococcales bacterium]|nr:carbohydrate porin [Myxococcales bacterium]
MTIASIGAFGVVLALATSAHADVKEDPCACSPVKPGFFRRGTLTGDWDDLRDKLKAKGIIPQAVYAGEVFAAPDQGLDHQVRGAGLLVLSLDLELEKLVDSHFGQLHVSTLAIHGHGLSADLMDLYGISGNVAEQDVRLFELWVEQPIHKATIRAGLLSADQEFILARHSTALLNATFGIISQLSFNVNGITVYPVATPGVSARLELPGFTARAAVFDGDQHGVHGIPNAIGPTSLTAGELEFGELLKLGIWHHTDRGNGYYAILDHQLERYLAAFVRVSSSPNQPVTKYIDTGIRIGPGPFRKHDFIGVGIAFAGTSARGAETLVEGTYQAQFGWLTIQPDFQLLFQRERTAVIIATRATIVF